MLTLSQIRDIAVPILKKYDVKQAFIFGSHARGEATDESDIDFYVDRTDSTVLCSLFKVGELSFDLVKSFNREVDVITKPIEKMEENEFKHELLRDMVKIYEKQ